MGRMVVWGLTTHEETWSVTSVCRFDSCTLHHPDIAQSGSARALGAWGRRFESYYPDQGDIAQLGERRFCKPKVTGSIPVVSTTLDAALSIEGSMNSGSYR